MAPTNQDVFAQLAAANTQPPAGADVFAQIHAQNQQAAAQPSGPTSTFYLPAPGGGPPIPMQVPAGGEQEFRQGVSQGQAIGAKTIIPAYASMAAPELAPEWIGDSWLGHALLTGIAGGLGTSAAQGLTGQNPASSQNLRESIGNAASFATLDGLFGAIPAIAEAKLGRSFVNQSLAATAPDVIYGNPAKAIEREGILSSFTGDIEKMKAAGNDMTAAGGRLGQVASRVQQLQPQLNQALTQSTARISVADAIDKPLTDAFSDIANNKAMTDPEKLAAITQIGGLQASLHQGIGQDISALEANQIKNQLGSRVRWNGTNAVGDEVKPAYKAVYVALKNAVNDAVPGMADLNERLTDLYAAQDDLLQLARREEVGRGMGMMRGTMGTSPMGVIGSGAGRFLPATAGTSSMAQIASKFAVPAIGSQYNPDIQASMPLSSLRGQ
jgi:hypothetical protein